MNEVGVEFYAVILPTTGGFVIGDSGTDFNEYEVTYRIPPPDAIVWHSHPPGSEINPRDAARTANRRLQQICSDGDDIMIYTSYFEKMSNAHVLARANVKQLTEITDFENSVLLHHVYRNSTWNSRNSYLSGRVDEEFISSITCQ